MRPRIDLLCTLMVASNFSACAAPWRKPVETSVSLPAKQSEIAPSSKVRFDNPQRAPEYKHEAHEPSELPLTIGVRRPVETLPPPAMKPLSWHNPEELRFARLPLILNVNTATDFSSAVNDPAQNGWETSVAASGHTILYTANYFAAFSDDGGKTFTTFYPYEDFPNNETFCCDQQVIYAPAIDRFILIYQTATGDAGRNRYKLLVTSPKTLIESRGAVWSSWNITPEVIRQQNTKNWFDFPDVGQNGTYFYLTFNLIGSGNSVVMRTPLSALANGSWIRFEFLQLPGGNLRFAQNQTRHMLMGQVADSSSVRVYLWRDGEPLLSSRRLTVSSISSSFSSPLPSPNSSIDWLAGNSKVSNRMLGASLAAGPLFWLAWTAGADNTFHQPHIEMLAVDPYTLAKVTERYIYNDKFAFAYPSLSANASGLLGLTYAWGGGIYGVRTGIGLMKGDDLTLVNTSDLGIGAGGHYITVREAYLQPYAASGGVYYRRPSNDFAAGVYYQTQDPDGGSRNHPQFINFGPLFP